MGHSMTKQKVDDSTIPYEEEVLFNSDTLSKIISYIPSIDVLSLALTCKRFGVLFDTVDDSIIKESARIAVQDIATEEELATLPYYDGENALTNYHYLQFMRGPLMFDQLVNAKYLNEEDKTCVLHSGVGGWATAISNNILRAGKHYVTFETYNMSVQIGVMRPGKANQIANGLPTSPEFYQNFTQRLGQGGEHVVDNSIRCCTLDKIRGYCVSSNWYDDPIFESWEGMEQTFGNFNLGMLLDLDEGTLSVYINRRKLGVMKSGLAGPYCWMVSLYKGKHVTIKRGTIPPS